MYSVNIVSFKQIPAQFMQTSLNMECQRQSKFVLVMWQAASERLCYIGK